MECSFNYDCISYICLYGIFSRLADLVVAFLQYKVMRLACGTQIFERYNMEFICIHEYYKKKFFFFLVKILQKIHSIEMCIRLVIHGSIISKIMDESSPPQLHFISHECYEKIYYIFLFIFKL